MFPEDVIKPQVARRISSIFFLQPVDSTAEQPNMVYNQFVAKVIGLLPADDTLRDPLT